MNGPASPRALVYTGAGVIGLGVALMAPGIWLALLGGTDYYWLSSSVLVISGALLCARRISGVWLYGFYLLGTLVWALTEVGLSGFELVPRTLVPALLGAWIFSPYLLRELGAGRSFHLKPARHYAALGVLAMVCVTVATLAAYESNKHKAGRKFATAALIDAAFDEASYPNAGNADWRHYGRTLAGERFSPLTQITPRNVADLEQAWVFRTGDRPDSAGRGEQHFSFEGTPIKVNDTLYLCTHGRRIFALDAVSGKLLWQFDPKTAQSPGARRDCRGVSYYEARNERTCRHRIVATTGDARLVALDAATGIPCARFGKRGYVSLADHLGAFQPGQYVIASPPLVVNDRIILGGWIQDDPVAREPSGVVRAYDAVTGTLSWAWDLGKSNPTKPLAPDEIYTRGTPSAWGVYTADPALGLVYVPLGNAMPEYWGGARRPFDEQYSSALVALDVETGKERWRFQTVYHDLWNFDLPIGPSLIDLPTSRGNVRALVQSTRMGELFLLDRRTGEPLAEVRHVPAPGNAVLSDSVSPAQPRSVGLPALTPQPLEARDTWGLTPLDHLWCRVQFRRFRYDGPFTPPSREGSIIYPSSNGIVDWYGVTIDPLHKILIANSSYRPLVVKLLAESPGKQQRTPLKARSDAPFAASVKPWTGLFGMPCHAPPWGKLTAIDLTTRSILWQRPLGTTRDKGPLGLRTNLPFATGAFNSGGNIVTGSRLIFVAATHDRYLRAFDERTGQELWKARLPAGGQATPMTYMAADGRQYVVIAAGGSDELRTRRGDHVVAFALPRQHIERPAGTLVADNGN